MRTADTILGLSRERGKKGLPLERVYRLLYNRDLYLMAYGKIYRNKGAMTHGVTEETPDGMSLAKVDALIEALRYERFQWLPARRTYIPQYTREGKKKANREYHKLMNLAYRLRQQGNTEEAEKLKREAQRLPTSMTDDPDYRRPNYVRYADDFVLGFIGPKSEAEAIKQQLKTFLHEQLKLELSEEKTLITHARSAAAKFLGYEINKLHDDRQRTKKKIGIGLETKCRTIKHVIGFRVPRSVIEAKCQCYMQGKEARHRAELLERSDYDIVMTYQLEYRGIANYSQLAHNIRDLSKLKWIMETSLTKTLASKHKMRVTQVYRKYGTTLTVQGKRYKGLQASVPREGKPPLVATWGGIPLKRDMKATLDERPPKVYGNRTELVQRLLAEFCELCGSDKDVEVHHERAMRKLHEYQEGRSPNG